MSIYHNVVISIDAGADHTVAITAAGEVYSWGGIVEHVEHATVNELGKKDWRVLRKKEMKQMNEADVRNPSMKNSEKITNKKQRDEKFILDCLNQKESDDNSTPRLLGRSLGVLGDGTVRSFHNSPNLIACRAQTELNEHHRNQENAGRGTGDGTGGGTGTTSSVASLAQRRATAVACGGWHTLVVTSGTHIGMDLRRPFEPGYNNLLENGWGTNNNNNNNNNNTSSGMNKGIGHWARYVFKY